jgi:hypothetical protein
LLKGKTIKLILRDGAAAARESPERMLTNTTGVRNRVVGV